MVEKSFSMDKARRSMENPLKAPNGGCWQTRVDGNAVVKSADDEDIYQRRKKRPGKRLFNGSDPAQNRETRSCRLRHIGSESQMSIEYHAKVYCLTKKTERFPFVIKFDLFTIKIDYYIFKKNCTKNKFVESTIHSQIIVVCVSTRVGLQPPGIFVLNEAVSRKVSQ
jgi:hypothetical protein